VAMISAREATSGTITIPGANWSQNFTVAANDVVTINLPKAAETLGSERVTVLPTPALGSDYYVLGYSGRRSNGQEFPSTFAVVASEDDTELVITDLTAPTEGGRGVGDDITVTLNQGQVYQVRST